MPQNRLGRAWGTRFDSLTSSCSLSSNPESAVASSHPMSASPRSASADEGGCAQSHDRIQPDASIFIGSLPANIEYADLTNMLAQHLSGHPQVKGIKVVRDSKGGTCAFIQCQDSEAASVLMNNLQLGAPQPFLGRFLRYEPARAFRTLLISYRSPRHYIRPRDTSRKANFVPTEDPRFVELQLPNAMRIVKTPGTRHYAIMYNSAALDATPTDGADPGLLLVPLLYDAESLLRIASLFGTVDYFGPYAHENEDDEVSASFPVPHDGPRSPVMDPGCWRVKWAHRDHCVSALMTLRRIPHLTVTWAHQSNLTTREQGYYNPRALPASHSWRGHGTGLGQRSASTFLSTSHTFPVLRPPEELSVIERPHGVKVTGPSSGSGVWKRESPTLPNDQNVPPVSQPSRPRALSLTHDRPQSAVSSLPSRESTGQLSFTSWESTSRTRWADHIESAEFKSSPSVTGPNFTSSPYLDHHIASSEGGCHISLEGDGQESDERISHTSDFGPSPITPRTPGSFMLRTPTTASYMGDFQSMSFRDYDNQGPLSQISHEKRDDHVVDPTTIFVGGLEMFGPNAWDENKVRALFSKYGGIEAVKVIRPSNKRSAFAFVKFNNTDAPARAVRAEHNRMLDGRLIRVQLRDWNPAYRHFWRPGPIKDSDSQPPNDHFSVDPKLPKPDTVNITPHMSGLQLAGSPNQLAPLPSGETCDLNEVQDENGIPPLEGSSGDDPVCDSKKEVRVSLDTKESEPGPQDTKPVSSQTTIVPAPALAGTYPAPTIQYYQGWIPNYALQFPYQMPFAGQPYHGYPIPPSVPPPPSQSGSDSGTPSSTPIPIGPAGGVYPTFMPYPPPLGHSSDTGLAATGHPGAANNPTLLHSQAPLIPTGFIQGDQGMLVPVYPPDALNHYMTGNQDQGQALNNSGSAEGQPPVTWRPFPPPPVCPQTVIFHSYINPPPAASPPHHLGPHVWIPGHAWHPVVPQSGNHHGVLDRRTSSSLAGPGSIPMALSFERGLAPRRQHRRDNHTQHHKNNFTRGMGGRFGKAPHGVPRSPSDVQPASAPQTTILDTSVDANWQHWNTDQGNLA